MKQIVDPQLLNTVADQPSSVDWRSMKYLRRTKDLLPGNQIRSENFKGFIAQNRQMPEASLADSTFEDMDISQTLLDRADLRGDTFRRYRLNNVSIKQALTNGLTLIDCSVERLDADGTKLHKEQMQGCQGFVRGRTPAQLEGEE